MYVHSKCKNQALSYNIYLQYNILGTTLFLYNKSLK